MTLEDACRDAIAGRPLEPMLRKTIVNRMLAEPAFRAGTRWRPIPIFDGPPR